MAQKTHFPRLSDVLKVDAAKMKKAGVFDGYVAVDSPVYIDPRLLENCANPEFKGSRKRLDAHFDGIFTLIRNIETEGDRFWLEAKKRLRFKENNKLSIGLSSGASHGHGIGNGLATEILRTARQIIKAGIEDTKIFELMGLLNQGIGADLISDMVSHVIYADILSFSERITRELKLPAEKVPY